MKIGFIGLGRMGRNMVSRLLEQGLSVACYDRTANVTDALYKSVSPKKYKGSCIKAYSVAELIGGLHTPQIVWLMVPQGKPVDEMISACLAAGISDGSVIIDGGNSYYKDSVRRFQSLKQKGIHFIDCGTSGGLEGARSGACLMLGGEARQVRDLKNLWEALATDHGWKYLGPSGAGHFVKMVHNGVEYAMCEALGEGMDVLHKGPYDLDLANIAEVWRYGSVIRGWLVELMARAFSRDPGLDEYIGTIGGGQTGSWTSDTARELDIKTPLIDGAVKMRKNSYREQLFSGKVVSALRYEFGGHDEGIPEKRKSR